MGNLFEIPNITPDVMKKINLNENNKDNKKSNFSEKNYLNVKLGKDEKVKNLTIRILPMDLETGNPFVKVHFHTLKVNKEYFGSEWKSYLCLQKNEDIDHETFGNKCPFCELNKKAYELSTKETNLTKVKELQKLSLNNKSIESVILRCIERGHEEDGVKFWKFNLRSDMTDPYNQIMALYNKRLEKTTKDGKPENILDIFNGRDLNVRITEGNAAPIITYEDDITPLSTDEELMKKWVYDKKRWQDVFTPKPYDFLLLVSEGKLPWFDNEAKKWVDKEEFDKNHKEEQTKREQEQKEVADKLKSDESENVVDDLKSKVSVPNDSEDEELPF